ncbi:MAG: nicotinate phosphoribosyltransferase [Pseudomonadota bacterium]
MFQQDNQVLHTDLYQLTMLQAYADAGLNATAVFEFYVRSFADKRNFLVAAGLAQVIDYLKNLHFSAAEIDFLHSTNIFKRAFVDSLADFSFSGDVYAMPEGSVFFPNEPILQIVAPLPQAQFIESRIINLLQLQTMIASKAIRCRIQVPDKRLVDFGMRRAHGAEAALYASRANYLAGFDGTATVSAGAKFAIPLYGTMAHAFIQAHDDEILAFKNYAQSLPDNLVLLIDTYDVMACAHKVIKLAKTLASQNIRIAAIRLDSGDLATLAKSVRQLFDENGCADIKIFASGDIDEYRLRDLKAAPIDGFGIGTKLDTCSDMAYLNCAYKMEMYADVAKKKLSQGKATWPGRKQVYRYYDADGIMQHDLLTLFTDKITDAQPLLLPIMQNGQVVAKDLTLTAARERLKTQVKQLPMQYLELAQFQPHYHVTISESLKRLSQRLDEQYRRDINGNHTI